MAMLVLTHHRRLLMEIRSMHGVENKFKNVVVSTDGKSILPWASADNWRWTLPIKRITGSGNPAVQEVCMWPLMQLVMGTAKMVLLLPQTISTLSKMVPNVSHQANGLVGGPNTMNQNSEEVQQVRRG